MKIRACFESYTILDMYEQISILRIKIDVFKHQ